MNTKQLLLLCISILVIFGSCRVSYKKLTRGNWTKDTTWVRYPDLPKPIYDTLEKFYAAEFSKDKSDDIDDIISLDSTKKIIDIEFYDSYNKKLKLIPFGWYFQIGHEKYFIDYSQSHSPFVYYKNCIYYLSGNFYDPSADPGLLTNEHEKWQYDKMYYVKYKLKK